MTEHGVPFSGHYDGTKTIPLRNLLLSAAREIHRDLPRS